MALLEVRRPSLQIARGPECRQVRAEGSSGAPVWTTPAVRMSQQLVERLCKEGI